MFKTLLLVIVVLMIFSRVYKKSDRDINIQKSMDRLARKKEKVRDKKGKTKTQEVNRPTTSSKFRSEWLRKKIVYVKRNPSVIPLIFMVISCLVFNLNLEDFSKTTLALLMDSMGLTLFVISLFSYLSIVTYLSAYPKRQKPSYLKIILSVLMIAASIALQIYYYHLIIVKTEIGPAIIQITADKAYILQAKKFVVIHCIFLSITLLLMLTLPLYSKWIRKINTSIQLEENQVNNVHVEQDIE